LGSKRNVNIMLPGGILKIKVRDDDSIRMTGPAEYEYEARFDLKQLLSKVE